MVITMKSKPSRRVEQGARSRQRILDAALRLIGERGFAGTSISAIVERSGLPPTSLYWHFESKEGLLAAVVEEAAARWFETVPAWEDFTGPVRARLTQLLDRVADLLAGEPEFLRMLLLLALERKQIDETTLAAIRRVRRQAIDRLQAILANVFEPLGTERAARLANECSGLALAFADGAFLAHHIDPETDLRRLFAVLRTMVLAYGESLIDDTGATHEK